MVLGLALNDAVGAAGGGGGGGGGGATFFLHAPAVMMSASVANSIIHFTLREFTSSSTKPFLMIATPGERGVCKHNA
jgi:hypothetical protein